MAKSPKNLAGSNCGLVVRLREVRHNSNPGFQINGGSWESIGIAQWLECLVRDRILYSSPGHAVRRMCE